MTMGCFRRIGKNKVFDFFGHSTTPDFVDSVKQMKGYVKSGLKTYSVTEILDNLEQDYISKLSAGKWVAKDTKQGKNSGFLIYNKDGSVTMCFNCGEIGHTVKDCPHALDEDAIAARKKLLFGNNGGRRGKREKYPKKTNPEEDKDKDTSTNTNTGKNTGKVKNPKRQPPKTDEPHEKDFDGSTLYWCGKCGRWTNHKTDDHKTKEELKKESGSDSGNFAGTALHF